MKWLGAARLLCDRCGLPIRVEPCNTCHVMLWVCPCFPHTRHIDGTSAEGATRSSEAPITEAPAFVGDSRRFR